MITKFGQWDAFRQTLWNALQTGHNPDRVDRIKLACEEIGQQIANDNNVKYHEQLALPKKRRLKSKARRMIENLRLDLKSAGVKLVA